MKVLFETHIATATVGALAKRAPSVQAETLAQWRGGVFRSADDARILTACHADGRVLVTFDQRTVPGLLRHWAAEGRDHSGVIFADEHTVRPNSPAEVAAAVAAQAAEIGNADTRNMVRFLRPAKR